MIKCLHLIPEVQNLPKRMVLNSGGFQVYLKKPMCFDCASFLYSPPVMDSCYVRRGAQGKEGWWVVGYWCRYCRSFITWEEWFILWKQGHFSMSFEFKKAFKFLDKEIYKMLQNSLRKKYGFKQL